MGRTHDLIRSFGRDISQSRYFQFYFVSWLIVVATGLGCLSYFSAQVGGEADHPYQLLWTQQLTSLNFPRFHFRTASQTDSGALPTILSVFCTHLNKTVSAGGKNMCNGYTSNSTCVVVEGPSIIATPSKKLFDTQRIDCLLEVNITGQPLPVENNLVAWELDNPNVSNYGDNSYASMWITPFTWTWVMITAESFDGNLGWRRDAMVHGYENVDNTTVAQYSVSTIIDSFTFWSYKSRNIVTGWNTAALCGGFCFFLYILQTLFMFFVGLSLENDSVILGGIESGTSSSSPETSRRTTLTENDSLMRHQHSDL